MGLFSKFFSLNSKEENSDENEKENNRKFDILKHDGIRALSIRKADYAAKCLREALKFEKDFETMKYLASAYLMLNDLECSLEIVNLMAEEKEETSQTLLFRANIYFMLERYSDAIADCNTVIVAEPDNYVAFYYLGKSNKAIGEFEKAIENFTKSVTLKEDFFDAYMQRAEVFMTMKNGNEALSDVNSVISQNPENEFAFLLRGKINESLLDFESALLDFRETIELAPFNEDAYLLAVNILTEQKNYNEAIIILDEAIEHNETFTKAYKQRALIKQETGDSDGAKQDMEIYEELIADETEDREMEVKGFEDVSKSVI